MTLFLKLYLAQLHKELVLALMYQSLESEKVIKESEYDGRVNDGLPHYCIARCLRDDPWFYPYKL